MPDPENNNELTNPRYRYYYDIYGNLIATLDPKGRVTRFTYNELNQQVRSFMPFAASLPPEPNVSDILDLALSGIDFEQKDYDALGRLVKATDFKGQITGYFYNNRGLLEYEQYYHSDANYPAEPDKVIQYTYDNLGRKRQVFVDTQLEQEFDYDAEGRITQIDTPEGTINYDYDPITGQKKSTYSANTDIDYSYDALNRLETVTKTATGEKITYGYDPVGNREWVEYNLNGTAGFEIETTYTYDVINRLTELIHQDTAGQLASYSYGLAADSQRVSLDESIKLTGGTSETHNISYGYDNINRLIDEVAESDDDGYDVYYEYDLAGNRTLREITVNAQPFRTEYEYDPNNDRLITEKQCQASCIFDISKERYYAYTNPSGKGFYYRDSNGNIIGPVRAFSLGLPTVWSRYLFIFAMTMVPVMLLGPAIRKLISRLLLCYSAPTKLRPRVPRRLVVILLRAPFRG